MPASHDRVCVLTDHPIPEVLILGLKCSDGRLESLQVLALFIPRPVTIQKRGGLVSQGNTRIWLNRLRDSQLCRGPIPDHPSRLALLLFGHRSFPVRVEPRFLDRIRIGGGGVGFTFECHG